MLYILAFVIKQMGPHVFLQRKGYFYDMQKGAASRLRPFQILSLIITNGMIYFNSNNTIPFISVAEAAITASNLPGSATQACWASSK